MNTHERLDTGRCAARLRRLSQSSPQGKAAMRIASLYRYPIKGLSPQALDDAELTADDYFPGDRLFAVENGPAGFDSAAPAHQPKIKFLMLMRNARLAALTSHYDDATGLLSLSLDGVEVARGDLATETGRAAIADFLGDFVGEELRGPARTLAAPQGFRFTDSKSGFVSLVNLASVAEIARASGRDVDPLRFRANIYIDGLEPWREHEMVGKAVEIGGARLDILKTTDRCAATGVAPGRGLRDMDIVQTLRLTWGHIDCGVYARVAESGRIRVGDAIRAG
jgi:uncharacterized protein